MTESQVMTIRQFKLNPLNSKGIQKG